MTEGYEGRNLFAASDGLSARTEAVYTHAGADFARPKVISTTARMDFARAKIVFAFTDFNYASAELDSTRAGVVYTFENVLSTLQKALSTHAELFSVVSHNRVKSGDIYMPTALALQDLFGYSTY